MLAGARSVRRHGPAVHSLAATMPHRPQPAPSSNTERDAIRSRCGESSQSIVEGVFADVATFQSGGAADDDRTIVVVTAQPDGADD